LPFNDLAAGPIRSLHHAAHLSSSQAVRCHGLFTGSAREECTPQGHQLDVTFFRPSAGPRQNPRRQRRRFSSKPPEPRPNSPDCRTVRSHRTAPYCYQYTTAGKPCRYFREAH